MPEPITGFTLFDAHLTGLGHATCGVDCGLFGDGLIPCVLTVQVNHAGLTLFTHACAQAGGLTSVGKAIDDDRLATGDTGRRQTNTQNNDTNRCAQQPNQLFLSAGWDRLHAFHLHRRCLGWIDQRITKGISGI